jgi:hypothetical protein
MRVYMKINNNIPALILIIILTAAGTFSCDTTNDKKDPVKQALPMGMGCMMNSPVVMKMTTYDMAGAVIKASEQDIFNFTLGATQPTMENMY